MKSKYRPRCIYCDKKLEGDKDSDEYRCPICKKLGVKHFISKKW